MSFFHETYTAGATGAVIYMSEKRARDAGDQPDHEAPMAKKFKTDTTMSCFIGNVSNALIEDDLYKVFSEISPMVIVRLAVDPVTGKNKGYGFATYGTASHAMSAIRNLNGRELGGRPLRVDHAEQAEVPSPAPPVALLPAPAPIEPRRAPAEPLWRPLYFDEEEEDPMWAPPSHYVFEYAPEDFRNGGRLRDHTRFMIGTRVEWYYDGVDSGGHIVGEVDQEVLVAVDRASNPYNYPVVAMDPRMLRISLHQ